MHTPYPGGFFYQTSTSRTLSPALITVGLGARLLAFLCEEVLYTKASGGDGIPVELFQILKDDAVKVHTQYDVSKFGKLSRGHRTGKGKVLFQSQREAVSKNAQTTTQLHSSHTLVN